LKKLLLQGRALVRYGGSVGIKPGKSDAEFFSMPKAEQEWIDQRLMELENA